MKAHEENMDKVIAATQKDLAGKIKDAEDKKQMPREAVIVSKTETVVFWGDPIQRKRFLRKWLNDTAANLPGKQKYELKKFGKTCIVTSVGKANNGELWHIMDHAEVEMNPQAEQRLKEKADVEALAAREKAEQEVAELKAETKQELDKEREELNAQEKNTKQSP